MRWALRVVPFTRLRAWMDATPARRRATDAAAIRRAMQRAERSFPRSTCLARALAGERMLRSAGLAARLTIGVARPVADRPGALPSLDAHAWVRSDGLLVAGDGELERYATLVEFGGP
jgi:hypothetical protein